MKNKRDIYCFLLPAIQPTTADAQDVVTET